LPLYDPGDVHKVIARHLVGAPYDQVKESVRNYQEIGSWSA